MFKLNLRNLVTVALIILLSAVSVNVYAQEAPSTTAGISDEITETLTDVGESEEKEVSVPMSIVEDWLLSNAPDKYIDPVAGSEEIAQGADNLDEGTTETVTKCNRIIRSVAILGFIAVTLWAAFLIIREMKRMWFTPQPTEQNRG